MIRTALFSLLTLLTVAASAVAVLPAQTVHAMTDPVRVECTPGGSTFLGVPRWDKYLDHYSNSLAGESGVNGNDCNVAFENINDVWKVGLAIVEMLTRVGSFIAFGYVTWGGVKFITSQGSPDGIQTARNMIIYALIGLVITLLATALVGFIGRSVAG